MLHGIAICCPVPHCPVLLRCADPEQARRLADHAIIDFTDLPPELLGTP